MSTTFIEQNGLGFYLHVHVRFDKLLNRLYIVFNFEEIPKYILQL